MVTSSILAQMTPWLYLRLTSLLLSVAALIILASMLPTTSNDSNYWADGNGSTFVGLPFAGNCWTILYSSIVLFIALSGNSQHPGVDIGMDFIGCGLNWAMGILLLWWTAEYVDDTDIQCDDTFGFDAADCGLARRMTGLHYAGAILTVLVGGLHFAHFVKACIDTRRRSVSHDRAKVMELGGYN